MWMSVEDDGKIKKTLQITQNEVNIVANAAPKLNRCWFIVFSYRVLLSAIKLKTTGD